MLKYNLISSFRSIKRNLSFSLINISGLAIGLALVVLLLAWLQFEFSFDRFHTNADRIFRVVVEFSRENSSDNFACTPAPLGDALKKEFSEVTDYVRFGKWDRALVRAGNNQYRETIEMSDPSIFRVFSFELSEGNAVTALDNPGSIIISESKARKFFGDKDPLGESMFIGDEMTPYVITGILKDIPANSQIQFDFLISFNAIKSNQDWGMWNYTTYILANSSNDFRTITGKLPEVVKDVPLEDHFQLHIQPLLKIHLHSGLRSDLPTNTNIRSVYIISSILILVLLIACINYMNLATSRFTKRGKEAGLRKVAGATNSNLAGQFLGESFAITLCAFIIALILVYLLIPVFTSITGIPLVFESLFTFKTVTEFLVLIILISVIGGSYPALVLSSVNPASTIRDDFRFGGFISVKAFRKVLIVFQFFISITLIACSLVIKSQLNYIKNTDLGLDPEQVVVVPIYQAGANTKYELYKKEISGNPAVLNASAVSYFPGTQGYYQNTWWEGLASDDYSHYMAWISVDEDFISTLKIELLQGEFFPRDIASKSKVCYVLNESAVKLTGWDDPLNKNFDIIDRGEVTGIVKDFNFKSLHNEIKPLALTYYPPLFDNLLIRISAGNIPNTLDYLRKTWEELFPQYPFEYTFMDEDFQRMYDEETKLSLIVTYISVLALFVSCIGLFGLVLFTIDSRIKEIGIRKVAGSTTGGIVMMLNLEYIRYIILAFIIACPVIIYSMHKWLQSFAYRVNLSWWFFVTAGLTAVLISLLTVSWHVWKSATQNPVRCLRHE